MREPAAQPDTDPPGTPPGGSIRRDLDDLWEPVPGQLALFDRDTTPADHPEQACE